jgi:hypothetical protein
MEFVLTFFYDHRTKVTRNSHYSLSLYIFDRDSVISRRGMKVFFLVLLACCSSLPRSVLPVLIDEENEEEATTSLDAIAVINNEQSSGVAMKVEEEEAWQVEEENMRVLLKGNTQNEAGKEDIESTAEQRKLYYGRYGKDKYCWHERNACNDSTVCRLTDGLSCFLT